MSRTPSAQPDPRAALRSGLPDRYLTPDDIAVLFGVPLETVYHWRKKRIGPPGFRAGRYVRYDPVAVHAWVTQQSELDTAA
ncbi:helix-turn-helix domain-containing protein [Streptomyces sp. LX-29]|uniref:helix-turn-helix domain-containing protein n=1 Tax=Streptomyces sp. LX-29 TaxID=2900152 RepID=UPI00240E69D0|nr:helix-turn-helix domain-containing protein [Streptomyces sp. LX-29]WFB09532.1 helix-turn-helix domain-containing protein [Streptomyces sp. LX-29]